MIGAFSSKGGSVSSVSSDAASCGAAGVVTAVVSAGFFSCANMPLTQNSGEGGAVGKGEIFPAAHNFDIRHKDRFDKLFAAWWVELLRVINKRAMRLRTGKINHYVLFALAFLVLIFLLSIFNLI